IYNATGLALGLFPGASYSEEVSSLGPGDLLAVYSDGVSEAWNAAEEEYGMERLTESLARVRDLPAAAIVEAGVTGLDAFVGAAPQHDDITFLALKGS